MSDESIEELKKQVIQGIDDMAFSRESTAKIKDYVLHQMMVAYRLGKHVSLSNVKKEISIMQTTM